MKLTTKKLIILTLAFCGWSTALIQAQTRSEEDAYYRKIYYLDSLIQSNPEAALLKIGELELDYSKFSDTIKVAFHSLN